METRTAGGLGVIASCPHRKNRKILTSFEFTFVYAMRGPFLCGFPQATTVINSVEDNAGETSQAAALALLLDPNRNKFFMTAVTKLPLSDSSVMSGISFRVCVI